MLEWVIRNRWEWNGLKRYSGLLLLLLLLFPFSLRAEYYDTTLLTLFSKILPRIVSFSSLAPHEGEPLGVCIVREDVDASAAKAFEILLRNAARKHEIESVQTDFSHISVCAKRQLLFLFDASPETVSTALSSFTDFRPLVASYNARLLSSGADVSLFVGRSVKPYINLKSLKEKEIRLDALILQVSKIYGQEPVQ
jgi:hypothetical protein